jgi:outer membrane protein
MFNEKLCFGATMFKSRRNKCWAVAAVVALFSFPLAAQERLTLQEAVARALANNPDLVVDAPGQQAARAEFDAARAGYLPRLDFEQSYLAGNNPVFVFGTLLTQQKFTAANFALPELNSPASTDNLQTRLTVQQTIWDFGRTRNRRDMADAGIKIADQSHEVHRLQVLLAVIEGYYLTSLTRESVETARLALRTAEAIENQARARVESGVAVESDLLRSQAFLSAAKQQEIYAQGQLESARANLNRLMGGSLNDSFGETVPLEPKKLLIPIEDALLAEQKQRRPDFQKLLIELNEAEAAVRSRQKEFLPVLAGYGTWESDNPSFSEAGGNNWAAGVTLRWNLFAGGGDAAQLKAARLRLDQKRLQIRAMESAMALEVRRALIQYRSAELQVAAAEAAEAQSTEGLRILKNRYDAGLATMTDLLSAETARSSARTSLAEAIYRQRLSYAQVEFAAGILGPTSPAMSIQ